MDHVNIISLHYLEMIVYKITGYNVIQFCKKYFYSCLLQYIKMLTMIDIIPVAGDVIKTSIFFFKLYFLNTLH